MNKRSIQVQILFLKLLSLSYLTAFVSLYKQIDSLMSSRGLMPAAATLKVIKDRSIPVLAAPTLLLWRDQLIEWMVAVSVRLGLDLGAYDKTDTLMYCLCLLAICLSFAATLSSRFHNYFVFFTCWIVYQSFVTVGGVYFHFQWDILLLEAGYEKIKLVFMLFW